jgi:hypothetical protein
MRRGTTRTVEISSLALVMIGVIGGCDDDFMMRVLNSVSITATAITASKVIGL